MLYLERDEVLAINRASYECCSGAPERPIGISMNGDQSPSMR